MNPFKDTIIFRAFTEESSTGSWVFGLILVASVLVARVIFAIQDRKR